MRFRERITGFTPLFAQTAERLLNTTLAANTAKTFRILQKEKLKIQARRQGRFLTTCRLSTRNGKEGVHKGHEAVHGFE